LFEAIREKQRFCSRRCRFAAWDRLHPRPRAPLLLIAERLETPELRRNRGKAIAASNHAPDLELARRLALELLATRGPGTIADLRDYAAREIELPFHLPWSANVFRSGRDVPEWFEATGERIATRHLRGNARKVNQYQLTPEGWAAYRETTQGER
jgi:hypothetical protein